MLYNPVAFVSCKHAATILLAYYTALAYDSESDDDECLKLELSENKDLEFDSSPSLLSQGSIHYACGIIYLCCV